MDNEFYTEEELGKAFNLMRQFGIESPEAIREFKAELDDGLLDVTIVQHFHYGDRFVKVTTETVSDTEVTQLNSIAEVLGFKPGVTELYVDTMKAKALHADSGLRQRNGVISENWDTKHLISQLEKKGTRNVE